MSTEAFGSRRVVESLKAIGSYLDEGVKLAGGVPPGQVSKLTLETIQVGQRPALTQVSPRVITVPLGEKVSRDVSAFGSHLTDVKIFKLVRGGVFFATTTFTVKGESKLTARFDDLVLTSPGSYDAWVTDGADQPALLNDACVIDSTEQEPTAPLQLGGIVPSQSDGDTTIYAFLTVLQGTVAKAYVTGIDGQPAQGWVVTLGEAEGKSSWPKPLSRVHQQYKEIATVPLSIKIPAVENPPRVFYLVAQSPEPVSEDRLVFSVVNQPSGS